MLQVRCVDNKGITVAPQRQHHSWGWSGHEPQNIPVEGAVYEVTYDNGHNYWIRFPAGHVVSWRRERFEVVS